MPCAVGHPTAKGFPSRAAVPPTVLVLRDGRAAWAALGTQRCQAQRTDVPLVPSYRQTCVPVLTAKSENQLEIKVRFMGSLQLL